MFMNELLILIHILWVSLAAFVARRFDYAANVGLMIAYSIIGNIMVLKQMSLGSRVVTTADVYAVGVILILNFIREDYDDKHVHKAMRYSFLSLFLFALAAFTQIAYEAIPGDQFDSSYQSIMAKMPSLVIKSACVYWVVQYIDNMLFSSMKRVFNDRYLLGRVLFSLVFSQCLDTVIFSMWALGDIAVSIWDIILFSSLVKVICSIVMMFYTSIFSGLKRLWGRFYV